MQTAEPHSKSVSTVYVTLYLKPLASLLQTLGFKMLAPSAAKTLKPQSVYSLSLTQVTKSAVWGEVSKPAGAGAEWL